MVTKAVRRQRSAWPISLAERDSPSKSAHHRRIVGEKIGMSAGDASGVNLSGPFRRHTLKHAQLEEPCLTRTEVGSVKQKQLPSPSMPELSTQMRPPIASTSCLLI